LPAPMTRRLCVRFPVRRAVQHFPARVAGLRLQSPDVALRRLDVLLLPQLVVSRFQLRDADVLVALPPVTVLLPARAADRQVQARKSRHFATWIYAQTALQDRANPEEPRRARSPLKTPDALGLIGPGFRPTARPLTSRRATADRSRRL